MSVSVAMIVRDGALTLSMALDSAWRIADEIVVGVDDRTTDNTADVARGGGARVHSFTWEDSFARARNLGLEKVKKDWVLVMDADDHLTHWGAQTLKEVMHKPMSDIDGYGFIIGEYDLDGKRTGEGISSVRFWRRSHKMRYWGYVHEQVRLDNKPLRIGRLQGGIMLQHIGYDRDLYAAADKDKRNVALLLKQLDEHPEDPHAVYFLARQHEFMGRTEQALRCAQYALEYYPSLNDEGREYMRGVVERCSESKRATSPTEGVLLECNR